MAPRGLQVTAKDQKSPYLGGRGALVRYHNAVLVLPIFKDRGRERFLIPASLAHGVLLEMVE